MDATRFDALLRVLSAARSRRGVTYSLAVATVGGIFSPLLGLLDVERADAKRKKKKKKKKKPISPPVSPPPPPPPPPSPVTTLDAECPGLLGNGLGTLRLAQSFVALRSGQLTSAQVVVNSFNQPANIVFEIRNVDQFDQPTNVLASATVPNVPPALVSEPVKADFSLPATVTIGQHYALVVTTSSLDLRPLVHGAEICGGKCFSDDDLDNVFNLLPDNDLLFATFVTA